MDALVAELLASSRLDFSALTLSAFNANDAARRALEREGMPAERLAVEGSGPAEIRADATLVARALANLIGNAKSHGGGLTELKVVADAAYVAFEASDAGPGFSEADAPRVFEPFYRGSADKTPDCPSLGLGLALVRRIAEAHGGTAYARNLAGGGALVGFRVARQAGRSVGS